jgi:hypothetical protein
MPTASYYDALCGHQMVILAYQLRHARHHARFSNVQEA